MTYSIVARDPDTGELGVAVQTRWPNVGSIVSWAEPGVGAVATQSFAEESYGPLGLTRMREGMAPAEALDALLADDPGRETRQVGLVDATGRSAAHAGTRCVSITRSISRSGKRAASLALDPIAGQPDRLGFRDPKAGGMRIPTISPSRIMSRTVPGERSRIQLTCSVETCSSIAASTPGDRFLTT